MTRLRHVVLIVLVLWPAVFAGPAARATPDADALSRACYARVGPLLHSADGRLTPEVRNAYLDWAEQTVLQALHESRQTVPENCLAEVRQDGTLRDAIFGSVFPPDPSILQNYAQLRAQLGDSFAVRYRALLLAISIAKRTKGVETTGESAEIGRDYQPGFWTDESLQVPGSEAEKAFIRDIAAFMKQSQVSAADLYQDSALQEQLKAALARQSVPANLIAEVKKSVPFGERLKNAMILLGQRPAGRDPKPTTVAWLRHLVAISAVSAASLQSPEVTGAAWRCVMTAQSGPGDSMWKTNWAAASSLTSATPPFPSAALRGSPRSPRAICTAWPYVMTARSGPGDTINTANWAAVTTPFSAAFRFK